jgi:hypothetical protein
VFIDLRVCEIHPVYENSPVASFIRYFGANCRHFTVTKSTASRRVEKSSSEVTGEKQKRVQRAEGSREVSLGIQSGSRVRSQESRHFVVFFLANRWAGGSLK